MAEGYYCTKCKKFILTIMGVFMHPHLGRKTCWMCRKCGGMVYLKEQEEGDAVI